ncbi:MAG TPA: cytochrome c [Vicinamibacterales bacterium]|nr:cytochrome c [Vicinamibacterales bacterium]
MATALRLLGRAALWACLWATTLWLADTRGAAARAEPLDQSPTFGVGRAPTPKELEAIDIDVTPDGRGLPPGSGTATRGKEVYASRCLNCHGPTGVEGPQDVLVGGQGTLVAASAVARPVKTVGSYWPYATTLWDYVRRAMPFDHPGTMVTDDVYAATAYLLFLNHIVGENDVLTDKTLPQVKMPNRDGFVPDPRPDVHKKK